MRATLPFEGARGRQNRRNDSGACRRRKGPGELAGACLVPDEQPFPSSERDAPGQSGGGDEVVAGRLHQPLPMTLEWIADRLCMGAATHVASLLQRHNQKGPTREETLF